jgi:hypothetical protein
MNRARVASVASHVAAAAIVGVPLWFAWKHGLLSLSPTGKPPSLPIPKDVHPIKIDPIRDWRVAYAAGVAATVMLTGSLNPIWPLKDLWQSRDNPWFRGHRWWRFARGVFGPALRQSSLRRAALVSGIVAIALWKIGRDGPPVIIMGLIPVFGCAAVVHMFLSRRSPLHAFLEWLGFTFLAVQAVSSAAWVAG